MSAEITMNEDIKKHLSWLVGRWESIEGHVTYPTIKPMSYKEELEFLQFGQPILNYKTMTYHAETLTPMHMESGFLKIKPGTNHLSFLNAHNLGITEIAEGEVEGQEIKLKSTKISRTPFVTTKVEQIEVVAITRTLTLKDEELLEYVEMETVNTPLQKHLRAVYKKI